MKLLHLLLGSIASVFSSETQHYTEDARMAHDLVAHSKVVINCSPKKIWPYILDQKDWKMGLSLVHHAGEKGQLGEILAAIDRRHPQEPVFFVKNIEMIPNRRRTMKLYEASAGPLLGYAILTLTKQHTDKTLVTYDVYGERLLPLDTASEMTPDAFSKLQEASYKDNNERFDKELEALKNLVEGKV